MKVPLALLSAQTIFNIFECSVTVGALAPLSSSHLITGPSQSSSNPLSGKSLLNADLGGHKQLGKGRSATSAFTVSGAGRRSSKWATTALHLSDKAEDPSSSASSSEGIKKSMTDLFSVFQTNTEGAGQLSTEGTSQSKTSNSISGIADAIKDNIKEGELGTRGEIYFALQVVLVLCILFGEIPIIGDFVSVVFGPGLVLLGGSVAALGVVELGTNLTPWPSPPKNGLLITDGFVFNEIRHPIYAGLLFLMLGLSMWSGSAMRVLLCVALWFLLDFKSELEEEELIEKFGTDYIMYRDRVEGKFIPQRLVDTIENISFAISADEDMDTKFE